MNLNFYSPHNANSLEGLQAALQDQMEKLDQIRNISISNSKTNQVQQSLQPQRYYLDCGVKEDWEEFLKINYNLTENQIFEDYKLFLQAKAEIYEDKNKEKLQNMKDKIIGPVGNKNTTEPQSQGANINNGNTIRVDNNTNNIPINRPRMENNAAQFENKGVKHVR